MRRTLIEVVVCTLLVVLAWGLCWWGGRKAEQRLAEQGQSYETQITDLRVKSDFWASELVASEAEAAFRSFIAGVSPAVFGGRNDSADLALISLLDLPGIDFAHLLRPNGEVVSSSDRKLTSAGSAGERANWALAATEIVSRQGDTRGVTELAAPIPGPDGPIAFLWLGYRTGEIKENSRPATLQSASKDAAESVDE